MEANLENHVASSAANQAEPRSSTDSPRDILIAARKLIEREENWCQGRYFGTQGQCCVDGALICATIHCQPSPDTAALVPNEHYETFSKASRLLADAMGQDIWEFNDSSTHDEVLAALDLAIEAAQ